jgi:hypothetical protein
MRMGVGCALGKFKSQGQRAGRHSAVFGGPVIPVPFGCQEACPVLRLRLQAKRGAPFVQTGWLAHLPQCQDAVLDQVLGAVDLRLAPVHQHAVTQVGQVPPAGVAAGDRVFQQGQAFLLKVWQRVLGQ